MTSPIHFLLHVGMGAYIPCGASVKSRGTNAHTKLNLGKQNHAGQKPWLFTPRLFTSWLFAGGLTATLRRSPTLHVRPTPLAAAKSKTKNLVCSTNCTRFAHPSIFTGRVHRSAPLTTA
eukprot:3371594-Rhodomonas_salina.1